MGTKDGYSVGDKAAAQEGSKSGAFDGLGVSMAPPCFGNLNVMAHPHRPFPGDGDDDDGFVVAGGPTSRGRRSMAGDIYEASAGAGAGVGVGGCFRNSHYQLHQPFDTQTSINTVAYKFPVGGGGGEEMAASLGFPFTNTQWKELERQAMIYKYMVASVPVPPHLLISPNFRHFPPDPAPAASLSLFGSNGFGSRLRSGGSDLEPGRCKRTDGKKWRCSRDTAPDQKYCERHLHRGRPRSRKPVELLPNDNANVINVNHNAENNKKTRLVTTAAHSDSGFPSNRAGSSWQINGANSLPYYQNHASTAKSDKRTTCDPDSPFILAYNQPRELEWLVNGGPFPVTMNDQDQQWRDQAAESSSINYQEEPSHLSLLGLFGSVESDHGNQHSFVNEARRPFIDAWSSSRNATGSPSRDGGNVAENDTSCIPISLALNRTHDLPSSSWTTPTTPGGPLAEVLNLTSVATDITGQSSPVAESGDYGVSPSTTSVSSPSGVLQRTLVSFSDGSGNSSPTLACSSANCPEIALPWLDHGRGNH